MSRFLTKIYNKCILNLKEGEMMLLDYLQNKYGVNSPIFMEDVSKRLDLRAASIRQGFKRLVDRGTLVRFTSGIYYFPQSSKIFQNIPLDMEKVIVSKYIKNDNKVIGYYSELTLANTAGITTQVAIEKCIVTNSEKSRGRIVIIKNRRIRLKAPRVIITGKNKNVLAVLDLVSDASKYSEYEPKTTARILQSYVKKLNISKPDVLACLPYYPSKTSKLLLEMGIYDVLT